MNLIHTILFHCTHSGTYLQLCGTLQANTHERFGDEQGVFTFMHRWILVVDQDSLRDLEPLVVNLTHVTAVASTRVPYELVCTGKYGTVQNDSKFETGGVVAEPFSRGTTT